MNIVKFFKAHLVSYPTPHSLGYQWGAGSLAGIVLTTQILTGVVLAMHYTANVTLAFDSIEHISRDVVGGWFVRYCHSNGASLFFFLLYIHIGRGLFYGSYARPMHLLWLSGVLIFVASMATAFIGYVLPWGQMSLWGATVIINLFSAIPVIGSSLTEWIWGGFSVCNATLNRFLSLHFLLPFLLIGIVIAHLNLLHTVGSNSPAGTGVVTEYVKFYPYYYLKDLVGLVVTIILYSLLIFFAPNVLGHADNYIQANELVTPAHIVPEWYFLPFYAILRAIPNKLLGVIAMFGSIAVIALLPFIELNEEKLLKYSITAHVSFIIFTVNFLFLLILGGKPADEPFVWCSFLCTLIHFSYILSVPVINILDHRFTYNRHDLINYEFKTSRSGNNSIPTDIEKNCRDDETPLRPRDRCFKKHQKLAWEFSYFKKCRKS